MRVQVTEEARAAEEFVPEGLVLAPVGDGGAWGAVRALRAAMRDLLGVGQPQATFVAAISGDGRVVPATDPQARTIALGYRVKRPS